MAERITLALYLVADLDRRKLGLAWYGTTTNRYVSPDDGTISFEMTHNGLLKLAGESAELIEDLLLERVSDHLERLSLDPPVL